MRPGACQDGSPVLPLISSGALGLLLLLELSLLDCTKGMKQVFQTLPALQMMPSVLPMIKLWVKSHVNGKVLSQWDSFQQQLSGNRIQNLHELGVRGGECEHVLTT